MATSYSLREQQDYRKLADIPLSRIQATKRVDKLHQLEIIEEDSTNTVKVHYTGYGSNDEWRDKEDTVVVESPKPGKILHVCLATLLCNITLCYVSLCTEVYHPFHLHNELSYQIKAALNSRARSDVDVRIELSFDKYLFIGGLQQAGKLVKRNRGHDIFTIRKYSSLKPLLGH